MSLTTIFIISTILCLYWPFLDTKRPVFACLITIHYVINLLIALKLFRYNLDFTCEYNLISGFVFCLKSSKIGSIFILTLEALWLISYFYSASYIKRAKE
ncbi:MAG: hypothetical protein SFT91_00635, partial [Rickettsiaceae bacterium]|nr:hypothetical protein [Rickettsiaceae bacterium]